MFVLGMLARSAADNAGLRPVLLTLLVVAVILIVAGCVIALLTLHNQRKDQFARIAVEQPDSEKT